MKNLFVHLKASWLSVTIGVCILFCATSAFAVPGYENVTTVDEMVQILHQECLAAVPTGEYDQAVWMHDWLIYHANYDETLSIHDPEGVLLQGTGVCESYATAFQLLLESLNIPCQIIASEQMEHAWNLVYLEGQWCHVDVTWDDPAGGGGENHNYFGMDDALASRDHTLENAETPACTTLSNYYPLRTGQQCFSTEEELAEILASQAENQANPLSALYVGSDPDFSTVDAVMKWVGKNNWKYGIADYAWSYTDYSCVLNDVMYTDPWEKPGNHLETPVAAPSFSMNSPEGCFTLSNYNGNGVVLVFGRNGCGNTNALLANLSNYRESFAEKGIEILVSVENAAAPMDIMPMENRFPGFHYLYEQSGLVWDYLAGVGFDTSRGYTYPVVFVLNGSGQIIYYSTGYVSDMEELVNEILTTSNSKPLPVPTEVETTPTITGNPNISSLPAGAVKTALTAACSGSRGVFFLTDSDVYYADALMMQTFEDDYRVFSQMGFSFVACYRETVSSDITSSYPHITFVSYDANDSFFWDLLNLVGFDSPQAYYQCCYYISGDGTVKDYRNNGTLSIWSKVAEQNADMTYDVVLPSTLSAIEPEAFRHTDLRSVDLTGSAISSIGEKAFADCPALTYVRIPATVTSIAADTFENSDNIIIVCPYKSAAAFFAENNAVTYYCP